MKIEEYLYLNIQLVKRNIECGNIPDEDTFENWENCLCDNCGYIGNPEKFQVLNVPGYENIKGYRGDIAQCPECGVEEKWSNIEDYID